MIKEALHAGVRRISHLLIGLSVLVRLLLALLDLLLDLSAGLLTCLVGLRGVRQFGEGARALTGRHVLGISELRGDAGAHVCHLRLVGLLLVTIDGSPHQLGHLGLELLCFLSCLKFCLLQCDNALSDAIHSCRRFHFLAHTGFLTGCGIGFNLKLRFFLRLGLRKGQVVLKSLVDDNIILS